MEWSGRDCPHTLFFMSIALLRVTEHALQPAQRFDRSVAQVLEGAAAASGEYTQQVI